MLNTNVLNRTENDTDEVFVTGTFDNWARSIKLEPNSDGHLEKEVILPLNEKVDYKVNHLPTSRCYRNSGVV